MRKVIYFLICGSLLLGLGTSPEEKQFVHAVDSAKGDEKADPIEEKRLNRFMREKLTSSQLVLEGLMTEDYDLMQKGAEKMIKLNNATDWQVR